MDDAGCRIAVAEASRAVAEAGLEDLIWGHVSIRDPGGRGAWVKSFSRALGDVTPEGVVLVDFDGNVLEGSGEPPLEVAIHTEVLAQRADVGSVVHTHAATVNAFSAMAEPVRAISHDGVLFADPPIPRFDETGDLVRTPALGRALALALGPAPACLLPCHGMVSVGPDVATAVAVAVLLERACRVQLQAMAAGGPRVWSDEAEVRAKRATLCTPRQFGAIYDHLVRRSSAEAAEERP